MNNNLERNLFFINNSISIDSGGRVQSMYLRSKALEDDVFSCNICTFNFRPNYGNIFEEIKRIKNLPKNLRFMNIYEFYSEENNLFFCKENKTFNMYYDFESYIQNNKNCQVFDYFGKRGLLKRVKLNVDNTVALIDYFHKKKRTKRDIFRKDGVLLRRNFYDYNNNLRQSDFFDSSERKYLSINYAESLEMTGAIHYSTEGTTNKFDSEKKFYDYWIFCLNKLYLHSYFFVENHHFDNCVIDNYFTNKIKSISTIHGNIYSGDGKYGNELRSYTKGTLENMEKFDAVIVLTDEIYKHISYQFGPRENLFIIGHPFFPKNVPDNLEKDFKRGVIISKYNKVKRITMAIKSFSKVIKKIPDARLDIFGQGEEKENYLSLINRLNLQDNVYIHDYTQDALKEFSRSGFSISTSRYEGFGISILESLSVQTPVIAFDYNYGPKDLIKERINGRLVPNGDINQLSKVIIDSIKNPIFSKEMIDNNSLILKKYSKPVIRNKLLHLLEYVDNNHDELPIVIQSFKSYNIDIVGDEFQKVVISCNLLFYPEGLKPKVFLHVDEPDLINDMPSLLYEAKPMVNKFIFEVKIPLIALKKIFERKSLNIWIGIKNGRQYQKISCPELNEKLLSILKNEIINID